MKPVLVMAAAAWVFLAGAACADVYRQVDAQGNVTFSDEPSSGAKPIRVKPVTTIKLPKPEDLEEQQPVEKQQEKSLYNTLVFTAPQNNQAFHSGNGNVEFQLLSEPALRSGHKYEVTIDGQPVGQSSTNTIMVPNMDRGTHQAGINIIDQNGVQVTSGTAISFTVHRSSRLN